MLNNRPGPANDNAIPFYHSVVSAVLSRAYDNEQKVAAHTDTVATLREVLFRVVKQYRGHASDKKLPLDLEDLLMATHYQHMLYLCNEHDLKDVAAKCSVTLLKYPDIIAPDKAFYQAGVTVREQGNINLAFMLLNRYILFINYLSEAFHILTQSFSF